MAVQYIREYKLTIGKPGELGETFSLHQIDFDITKSLKGTPNTATIGVYNLPQEKENLLSDDTNRIILEAGYLTHVRTIFVGALRNVSRERRDVDTITWLYCGDGDTDLTQTYINETIESGANVTSILSRVSKRLRESTLGAMEGLTDKNEKLLGITLSGGMQETLNRLGRDYNFKWQIQDGIFEVLDNDSYFTDRGTVQISNQNGMLYSPTVTEEGVQVTTYLNPDLRLGRLFQVTAEAATVSLGDELFKPSKKVRTTANGIYRCDNIHFFGDSESQTWYSEFTGKYLKGV